MFMFQIDHLEKRSSVLFFLNVSMPLVVYKEEKCLL